MIKSMFFIVSLLLVTGCFDDKGDKVKNISESQTCYEIVNIPSSSMSPILLNKCNGDTYIALREEFPIRDNELTPSYTWKWVRVERFAGENSVAGMKKQ